MATKKNRDNRARDTRPENANQAWLAAAQAAGAADEIAELSAFIAAYKELFVGQDGYAGLI